jgi:hypothetical protein
MKIGTTRTVSYEDSRRLRKEGWMPRNDIVVMMYVGKPEKPAPSNRSRANRLEWTIADHAFVDRKIAGQTP